MYIRALLSTNGAPVQEMLAFKAYYGTIDVHRYWQSGMARISRIPRQYRRLAFKAERDK